MGLSDSNISIMTSLVESGGQGHYRPVTLHAEVCVLLILFGEEFLALIPSVTYTKLFRNKFLWSLKTLI